jgi:hypothetical protein
MKRILVLILLLSMPLNSFSMECPTSVKLLEEGTPAPCRGFLFSPNKELEVRILKQEHTLQTLELENIQKMLEKFKLKDLNYEEIIEKEQQKTELWRTKAEEATQKLIASESGRTTRDVLFIGLGILLTVGAGYAIGQVAR